MHRESIVGVGVHTKSLAESFNGLLAGGGLAADLADSISDPFCTDTLGVLQLIESQIDGFDDVRLSLPPLMRVGNIEVVEFRLQSRREHAARFGREHI